MRRFLKWFGIGLASLVALLVVGAFFFQWNWVRGYANSQGSSRLGREFAIDGDLHVNWGGWTPHIHAEKVRLGNAEWAKEANLVEFGAIDFRIDVRELFRGRVVLPELTLDQPKIALEKADEKRKNWELPFASPANAAVNATVPDERSEFPVIGRLQINDGRLIYDDKPLGLNLNSTISTATGAASDKEPSVRLQSRGTIQGGPLTLNVRGGSILALRENDEPYPLNVEIVAGATRFSAHGTMTDPIQLKGVDLQLDTQGDNLADIFPLTGIPLPPTKAYRISGRLHKEGDVWSFEKFAGRVGDSDLGGDMSVDAGGARNVVKAALVSKLLDIKDLAGFIGAGPAEKGQTAEDRLIPNVPLDLSRLRAADMDVTLKAQRINAPGAPIDNMDSRFLLQEGLLKIEPLKFGVAEGVIAGTVTLDGRSDMPKLQTDLDLQRLSLKRFFEGTSFESLSTGTFGGKVQINGQGKSLAEVMAGGNGRMSMGMAGGQLSTLIVHAADLDIAKVAATIVGSDKPTELRCAVADFVMQDGVMNTRVLVVDTTASNITGDAAINFKNETMDIRVKGKPKQASPVVASTAIVVKGKMKDPSIGIDPAELAARGAAATALGIVLTPLAAILPFIDPGMGKDSDCAALVAQVDSPEVRNAAHPPPTNRKPANQAPATGNPSIATVPPTGETKKPLTPPRGARKP